MFKTDVSLSTFDRQIDEMKRTTVF